MWIRSLHFQPLPINDRHCCTKSWMLLLIGLHYRALPSTAHHSKMLSCHRSPILLLRTWDHHHAIRKSVQTTNIQDSRSGTHYSRRKSHISPLSSNAEQCSKMQHFVTHSRGFSGRLLLVVLSAHNMICTWLVFAISASQTNPTFRIRFKNWENLVLFLRFHS